MTHPSIQNLCRAVLFYPDLPVPLRRLFYLSLPPFFFFSVLFEIYISKHSPLDRGRLDRVPLRPLRTFRLVLQDFGPGS